MQKTVNKKVSRKQFFLAVFLLLSLFFMGVSASYAKELPSLYRGIRPLGMGNAFIAVSDDENGLFYNPAGLKLGSEKSVAILNPLFEFSQGSLDLYNDASNLNKNNSSEVSTFLNKRIGEHQHIRFSFSPHVFVPPFAIAVLAQGTVDMAVRNPIFPEVETNLRADLGLVVGGARNFGSGIVGGMTVKYIQRKGIIKTYTASDISDSSFDPKNDLKTASDFSFDLGGMTHLSQWLDIEERWGNPTVGVVLQNITDLDFKENGVHPMQVNVGVALHPEIATLKSTFALDVVDITQQLGTDNDLGKRLHVGAEFKFPQVVSLRLGFNQGYFTGGMTFDFWIIKLDIATFSEELGAFAGQRADRRTLAQLSLGF